MDRLAFVSHILATPALTVAAATGTDAAHSLAPLELASGWLGGRESAASLRGRIVLVDVFTFECINCTRVTPNLKRLYATYPRREFEIVAVHTPEVPSYQSRLAYLSEQRRAVGISWPIAIDNGYRIWNAYGVSAWPTQLFFDRAGRLRETIVGDGSDRSVTATVRRLIETNV